MTSSSAGTRRRTAYAARAAAKQRRQRNVAIVGFVVLIVIAGYEVPHILKSLHHHGTTALATTTSPGPTAVAPKRIRLTRATGTDPFAARSLASDDPTVGQAIPGNDPFEPYAAARPSQASTAAQPLPQTIVIGSPRNGQAAVHGWIVILASIPTGEGRSSAEAFVQRAASRLGNLSILNSSNSKPLRGGYWVVYNGPFRTLGEVSKQASAVHAAGYPSAYIRELIVYR
jgi:hypothetical protein